MQFEVIVGVTANVDSVTVDGIPVSMTPGMRSFDYTASFSSYDDAVRSQPVTFDFMSGAVIAFSGDIAPGFCKRDCVSASCPPWAEVVHEIVRIPSQDQLGPSFFGCIECDTATDLIGLCP